MLSLHLKKGEKVIDAYWYIQDLIQEHLSWMH